MKAMVLAAGKGERMQPLTAETPKPLLEVSGKPLLAYHLEALAAAGFKQVVINVSWLAEQIVVFCGDGSRWGLHIQFSLEAAPLETAGGICQALPLLGDAPFALINADVFSDFPLGNLRNVALSPTGAHVVLVPNPPQHQQGDFALEANTVMRGLPTERLTYAGIGVYQSRFFEGHMSGLIRFVPGFYALLTEQS